MVEFRNASVRSIRRIRCEFSTALASGAFVTSWFTLTCDDGSTGDPGVSAALAVPNQPTLVELVVDRDLADGGQYSLSIAAGVPALDASTAPAAVHHFYTPNRPKAPSPSISATDIVDIVFQEDVAHDTNSGHQLAPDGDLATITGPANVKVTAQRGLVALDPYWGASLMEDVDSAMTGLRQLRGKAERQLRRDDRIVRCKANAIDAGGGDVVLTAACELIGEIQTNVEATVNAGN